MRYFLQTFGCQANKSDSERIEGDYQARGFSSVANWQDADEIIINTCAVRQRAEHRVKGLLLNIVKYFTKKGKIRPKIILTGCMVHHGPKKLHELLPMVDEILPINEVGFNSPAIRHDNNHAWVPISSGCNSFCTFCIVPYSRGREISRPQDNVISEILELANKGYSEITLLGQNVNSYGLEKTGIGLRKMLMNKDKLTPSDVPTNQSQYLSPDAEPPFVTLIKRISQIEAIKKIHFMTSNPWDFWDALIDEIASNPKIDRFIHLPVQSGSNRILKLMNRGYTRESYLTLVNKIKSKIPDTVLGTDIIVGFPGETDADFQDTLSLIKDINFHVAFVAQYSPRPGTAAWRLYQDDVPAKVKKERWQILDQITNKDHLDSRPYIP